MVAYQIQVSNKTGPAFYLFLSGNL